ncbi:MAG: lytic transglycosylase domain-containing protein, partial [Myxococcota bacterium]
DAARELAGVRYGPELRLYFARLFQEVEDYYSASRLILRRHAGAMSRSVKRTHDLLRYTYPDAYGARVRAEAARYGVDPRMAWAVMREESTYRPRIRSPAGAVGLMQVMPATATRLEGKIGVTGAAGKLENPGVNIRLGTYYLSWLMKRYRGRMPRALAGYNAGEDAVDRWLKELPAAILKEPDAFIEEIPYKETRNYVKKVLKSYYVYERLYPGAGKSGG